MSNPYGAAILLDDFLDAKLNTTGAIYIWDDNDSESSRGSNDHYMVANKTGAVEYMLPPEWDQIVKRAGMAILDPQAFFVQLNSSAGTITFEEAMRERETMKTIISLEKTRTRCQITHRVVLRRTC